MPHAILIELFTEGGAGTLITAAGVTYMDFDRQANSLDEAVRRAIADINAAGFRVARVEIEADCLAPQQA